MHNFISTVPVIPFLGIYPKVIIIDILLKFRKCIETLISVVSSLMHCFPGTGPKTKQIMENPEPQHVMWGHLANFHLHLLELQLHCRMR